MTLVHHELCFGCGRVNLFGLLLEVEPAGADAVAGRCFFKQDHQGADRGVAHDGVVAAALAEAMALVCGPDARATELELRLLAPAPIGSFLAVLATVERREGAAAYAGASLAIEAGSPLAQARGTFRR
ncbi:MAG: hypothetical protein JO168_24150 [Solirubrobacterales bacterium]|nr:hypothetical protein [Solirubrobacterales bacterium]MBV9714683.1 hypothetical protein [Solirubrobacterales bacterium]